MEKKVVNLLIALVAATITGLGFGLMFSVESGLVTGVFMFASVLHIVFKIDKDNSKKIRLDQDGNPT